MAKLPNRPGTSDSRSELVDSLMELTFKQLKKMLKDKKMSCPGCSTKEDMVRQLLKESMHQRVAEAGGEDSTLDVINGWIQYFYWQLLYNPINSLCWVALVGFAM